LLMGLWLVPVEAAVALDVDESFERFAENPSPPLDIEPFGAEELQAEDDSPHIPEPLVFDLVRPLGAKRGEFEINTLALIPLNRRAVRNPLPDSIGLLTEGRSHTEWAPEVEAVIVDNLAVEFELPFEEDTLGAYKAAGQYTFGRILDGRAIHGVQGIIFYGKESGNWSPVLLYLMGMQFDENWSAMAMIGFRTEINGEDRADRTERLVNFSVFRHVRDNLTVGVETNTATSLGGASQILLMPQIHWEITDHWMLQAGAGALFTRDYTLPEAGLRLIRSF